MNGTHHGAGDNPRMTTESSMSDHDVEAIAASLPVRDGDEPWTRPLPKPRMILLTS